jgi:Tfp pilus assembly protein PilE
VAVGNGYYTVTVAVPVPAATAAPTFTVTAVPAAGSSQLLDTACQLFSVDQLGNQTALDAGGAVNTATCWGS